MGAPGDLELQSGPPSHLLPIGAVLEGHHVSCEGHRLAHTDERPTPEGETEVAGIIGFREGPHGSQEEDIGQRHGQ